MPPLVLPTLGPTKLGVQLQSWTQGAIDVSISGGGNLVADGVKLCLGSEAAAALYPPNNRTARINAFIQAIEKHNLWGSVIPCWAYLANDGVPIAKTKSPVVHLPMPIRYYQGSLYSADAPSKSQPAPKILATGQARRLVLLGNQLFFAKADGHLETSESGRGFDPFNYLLSLFDICSTSPAGPATGGQDLCLRLGAVKPPAGIPLAGTWASIAAALPASVDVDYKALLVWSPTQAFLVAPHVAQLRVYGFLSKGYVEAPAKTFQIGGTWEVARITKPAVGMKQSGQSSGQEYGGPWKNL